MDINKIIKEEIDNELEKIRLKHKVHFSLDAFSACRTTLKNEGYNITGKAEYLKDKRGMKVEFQGNDGKKYNLIIEEI